MKLEQLLTEADYKEYFIKGEQLIVVKTNEEKATVYLYEKQKEVWVNKKILQNAFIGKKGITRQKCEGDKKTPYGLYPLGFAFGIERKPQECIYPYKIVTDEIYWVDDIKSKYYNQWVEITKEQVQEEYHYCKTSDKIEWKSAEHLVEYKVQYQYAVVIEYNTLNPFNTEENQGNRLGSAIFLHVVNNGPTDGCVAVSKEDMYAVLVWLKKEKNPQILIY